jgi:hypothetical protein
LRAAIHYFPDLNMRYRLRTLLVVLAVEPPLLWLAWMSGAEALIVFLMFFGLAVPSFIAAMSVRWLVNLFADENQAGTSD